MKYELMIHGKPNAGSFTASSGIEAEFANTLNDEFFRSMGSFKGQDFLIVDARFWKGVWYSIYTYWYSINVKGIGDDGRDSYIAVSVIVPKSYYIFNSGVYDRLKKLLERYIVGTYISKKGEYLVQNFSQDERFVNLYSAFGKNFSNLEEDFDNQFNPNNHTNTAICYNPLDCDSKAFVEDLKSAGRVFISDRFSTKNEKSGLVDQYKNELDKAKAKVHSQDQEINLLNQKVVALQQNLDNNQRVGNNKYGELQKKYAVLQKEHGILVEKLQNIQMSFNPLLDNVQSLSNLLDIKRKNSIQSKQHDSDYKTPKTKGISLYRSLYLPLLNTLLILLFGFWILARSNSSNEDGEAKIERNMETVTNTDTITGEEPSDETLNENLEVSNTEQNQKSEIAIVNSNKTTTSKDADCELNMTEADGSPLNMALHTPKRLKFSPHKGYDFYLDNIKDDNNVKAAIMSGREFTIIKINSKKPANITYRSNDPSKLNEKNVKTIK